MVKVKLGIIGCGKQASKHISSLKKIPGIEMVLADINNKLARTLAEKNGQIWVEHTDDIYSDERIQAVVICTPTRTHASLIHKAIDAHKDIFCEKPLSDSLEEALKIKKHITTSGRFLMVGYIYRFVPIFEEGFKLVRKLQIKGESLILDKPLSAFFRLGGKGGHELWKHKKATGGGAINEMLVHMIDLANWYFGPIRKLEVISCDLRYADRMIQKEMIKADAEDYILVKCIGANGVELFCQADLITPAFSQYVEIQGKNGSFMGSIQSDMPSYVFLKESRGGFGSGKTDLNYGGRNVLDIQMMYFIQSILSKELPDRNTIEDSLELIELMDDIRRQVWI